MGSPVLPDDRRVGPVASRAELDGAAGEGFSDRVAAAGVLEATEIVVEVRELERTGRSRAAKNHQRATIAACGIGEATLSFSNDAELIEHFRDKRMSGAQLGLYAAESLFQSRAGDGQASTEQRAPSEIEISVEVRSERGISLTSARRGALGASDCDSCYRWNPLRQPHP